MKNIEKISQNPPIREFDLTRQHEAYFLSLRKKNITEYISLKRKANMSDIIKLKCEINPGVLNIITQSDTKEIFTLIKEIFNSSYNESNVKRGLHLLREKLTNQLVDEKTINTYEIIENGFIDIVLRIFDLSKKEIETEDNNDSLLYEIYFILINFSYYANKEQNAFFITRQFMLYHSFFLKYSSNDKLIGNIIFLFANYANENSKEIFDNKNNEDFTNSIIDIATSAIAHNKIDILISINDLLNAYIFSIYSHAKTFKFNVELNLKFIISSLSIVHNLLNIQSLFDTAIYCVSKTMKLLIKENLSSALLTYISNHKDLFSTLLSVDYMSSSSKANALVAFSSIISSIFVAESVQLPPVAENNVQMMDRIYLSIVEYLIEELFIIDFFNSRFKENFSSRVKCKIIKAVRDLTLIERFINNVIENEITTSIINSVNCSNYSIRRASLDFLLSISKFKMFSIGASLIKRGLLIKMISLIDPESSMCPDAEIILTCLEIITNILNKGEWIEKINGKNSFVEKFEIIGGRNAIEKLLGHPNKRVYLRAEEFESCFFPNCEMEY